MPTTATKKKAKGSRGPKEGTTYNRDPRAKLNRGEKWTLTVDFTGELGHAILDKHAKCPKGTQYQTIVIEELKKRFKIKG